MVSTLCTCPTTAVASTHALLTLDSFVARFQPSLRVAKDLTEVNLENLTEFVITENPAWRVGGGGGREVKGGRAPAGHPRHLLCEHEGT